MSRQSEYLKSLRAKSRMTQVAVAFRVGCIHQQYSLFERGTRKIGWEYIIPLMKVMKGSLTTMVGNIMADYKDDLKKEFKKAGLSLE